MRPRPKSRHGLPAFALAGVLLLGRPVVARAENSLGFEYEDYREPNRIDVITQSALYNQDLGTDMHFTVTGVTDAIAGATPTGQPAPSGSNQVVLSEMHDYRKAWNSDLTRQFADFSVSVGFGRSVEGDYQSDGWSLNTLTDFNQKNTTLLVGVAGTSDLVEVFFEPAWLRKYGNDFIVGVTQLIDPLTSVSLNLTVSHENGFLNDQYKLVQKAIQIDPGIFIPETFAESRPGVRTKGDLYASINRSFPKLRGAIDVSYRFYHDTYGIFANTVDVTWLQRIGGKFILEPNIRLYQQSAASFYHYNLDATTIVPTQFPNPGGTHYSSDARLSEFKEADYGVKLVCNVTDSISLDAGIKGYTQRGTDGVTPQSAYYRATITTAGATYIW